MKKYLFILMFSILLSQNNSTPEEKIDSLLMNPLYDDLFETLITEAKMFFSDAIISDIMSDTLDAMYQFDNVFKALTQLELISEKDELDNLKYQKLMKAVIEYYDNRVSSIDHSNTGFSTAIFKEKLDNYIYSQSLDELTNVEETVEIIDGHIPITYNKKVKSIINYYTTKGRSSIQKWLNREAKYKDIILPILESKGVPREIFYVAMIESGFKPRARSFANAVGYWQFIEPTAKAYGLKKDFYYDERMDFEKSTEAACDYLLYLYGRYNDWYLAFAAYNTGETRIDRHIKYFKTKNYWELTNLPKETQNYVPSILAYIFISKNPKKYGFTVDSEPLIDWNVIDIKKSVKVDDIAKCSKIDKNILLEYNPEILREYISLDTDEIYKFRMPKNCSPQFDSLFALIEESSSNHIVYKKHKIKKGESLWSIAIKYGSTITAICEVNKLDRKKPIRIGKTITVPIGQYKTQPRKTYYTIKKGDTLSGIAVKYKVSVSKIKKWNGLRSNTIHPGKKLVIHK
ncbi:MAG: hypothetical protein CMG66_06375 [Candidatus Marinimicrobia bacterium]|nr:hypothetical protein [Candidatus Neomarinimicrobiota bacterium]|tara:strand:+ start:25652 stop:27199 length:1548 start_codon:yes stop_codon:yes gene_type:complete